MVKKKKHRQSLPSYVRFLIDEEVRKILLKINPGDRSGWIRQAIKEKHKRGGDKD